MHGQIVSLSFLLDKLKWGLLTVDQEISSGGIESIMKGGQVHYKLNKDYGQERALNDMMKRKKSMFNVTNIGTFVNRKNVKQ